MPFYLRDSSGLPAPAYTRPAAPLPPPPRNDWPVHADPPSSGWPDGQIHAGPFQPPPTAVVQPNQAAVDRMFNSLPPLRGGGPVVTDSYTHPLPPPGPVPQAAGGMSQPPSLPTGLPPDIPAPPAAGNLLDTDPGLVAARAQERLGLSQLNDWLRAERARAIISFGDPAMAGVAGFGLDPQDAAFARQNYLSGNATLARLDKQRDQAKKQLISRLAARGILQSGDLGYGLGEAESAYGNSAYDARQQLLNFLSGLSSQDLEKRTSLSNLVVQALQGAQQNVLEHPDAYATPNPPKKATAPVPPEAPVPPVPPDPWQRRFGKAKPVPPDPWQRRFGIV